MLSEGRGRVVRNGDADWDLVGRIKAGDDAAFDTLMQRHKRPILSFIFRMIGDASEAEDVAQVVFVRAFSAIRKPSFRHSTAAFSTWLFQVARNAALDSLRARKRRPVDFFSAWEDEGAALPAAGPSADTEVVAAETGKLIAAAMALLPEDQRAAIILAEYENRSYAEIAEVLKCSPKSVEARLYRARQFLRKRLARYLRENSSYAHT
jgi:RNA polymerase sigma-70 factor (ECF subfamily)